MNLENLSFSDGDPPDPWPFFGSGIHENNAKRIPDPYRVAKSKDKTPEPYWYYSYSIIMMLNTILYHLSFIVCTKDML